MALGRILLLWPEIARDDLCLKAAVEKDEVCPGIQLAPSRGSAPSLSSLAAKKVKISLSHGPAPGVEKHNNLLKLNTFKQSQIGSISRHILFGRAAQHLASSARIAVRGDRTIDRSL